MRTRNIHTRALALLLAMILIVATIPVAASAASTKYVKTGNGLSLNMRSSRKTHADNIIGHIPYGSKVTVYSSGSGWSYISYKGRKGYVVTRLLADGNPGTYTKSRIRYVRSSNGNSVNIRTTPESHKLNVIGAVPNGGKVTIYDTVGNWTKVKYGNIVGYMSSAYLKMY